MSITFFQEKLIALDQLLNAGKFAQCTTIISQISEKLNSTFFTPSCQNFNIDFLNKELFSRIIKLAISQNERVAKISKKFLLHWFSIYASIAPAYFIKMFYEFMQEIKKNQILNLLMPSIEIAFCNIGKEDIKADIQLILNVISFIITFADSSCVPIRSWEIISDFCQDNEIIQNLPKCQKNARAASILIKRNPGIFMDSILQSEPLSFLSELFLLIRPGCKINYTVILDRISQNVLNPADSNINYNDGCVLLAEIINYIDLPIKEEYLNKITKIIEHVSFAGNEELERATPEASFGILTLLLSAAKKNLYSKDSLKKINTAILSKIQNSASRAAYLNSIIFCVEKDDDLALIYQLSQSLKPWLYQDDFLKEVEIITSNLPILVEHDKKFLTHFVWVCTHPVMLDIKSALAVIKLFNKLDNEILFDKQFSFKADKFIYKYIELNNPELKEQIVKFIKKCHIKLDITKLDLSSENSGYLLPFIDDKIFREMVDYHMYPPNSLHNVLNIMVRSPKQYPSYLKHAFGILQLICYEFGINLNEIYTQHSLPTSKQDETLITKEEVHNLFTSIKGSLYESPFGQLVRSCVNAILANFQTKPHQNNIQNEISYVSRIVIVASKIIVFCPTLLFELLAKCRIFYNNAGKDEKLRLIFHKALEDIHKTKLSTKFAAYYVKFLFSVQNTEVIFKENSKYGFEAATVDRFVASHLKILIDKDYFSELKNVIDITNLKPIPTFLSFIGSKKQERWVNECANTIDPKDWILSKSDDLDYIFSKLKLNEDQKERIMNTIKDRISKIKEEKPKPTPQVYDYCNRAESFTFSPVNVAETSFKVHETEPATLYNVISFLYHSTLPLPETVTLKSIEELAFKNTRSSKLLIGFFLYAYRKKYQIDVEQWSKKLYIKTFNNTWYLVVALFLLNVKGKITELKYLFQNVVKKCFVSLGYQRMNHTTFIQAYQKEVGVRWFFVRNAILVDIDYFKDYPLIISELKMNKKNFKDFFENVNDISAKSIFRVCFATMCNMFVKPADSDLILKGLYPTNYLYPARMLHLKEGINPNKRTRFPDDLIDMIISGLKKQSFVPLNFFYFFSTICLNDNQYQQIEELFFTKKDSTQKISKVYTSLRNIAAPAYYLLDNHEEDDIINFYSFKPPSFSRAFFRSLQFNFAKQIDQSKVKSVVNYLPEVFPDLCYNNYSKYGMKMAKNALSFSKLLFGNLDNESGRNLVKELSYASEEAIDIYNGLCSLNDKQLALALPYTKTMLKEELGRMVIEAAVSDVSNFSFAAAVAKNVIKVLGHASTLAIIGNRDFLGKSNFELVLIILHILEKVMKKENAQDGLSFFEVLRGEKDNLFSDQMKAQAFTDFSQLENLDAIVHKKLSQPHDSIQPAKNSQPTENNQTTENTQPTENAQPQ